MWRTAAAGLPFSSCQFSSQDEVFCFLKVEGLDLANRSSLEDVLDASLRPEALGCVLGGGSGLRYGYIDLAVGAAQWARAIIIITGLVRNAGLPKRSWVLFFDDVLQEEWVGIYEDTPAPTFR